MKLAPPSLFLYRITSGIMSVWTLQVLSEPVVYEYSLSNLPVKNQ